VATVVCCWSAKGGAGTTVVATALALVMAQRSQGGVLLVDLAGDAPAALGLSDPAGPGVAGWAAAGPDVPADGLARLAVPVLPDLELLPRGDAPLAGRERFELLAGLLAADDRAVVVDAGLLTADSPHAVLAASATTSLLVTRPCYLALRRAVATPLRPSGVVLVGEPGRALDRGDVEGVLGVPVVAELTTDIAVARAVDAGLLASRLPRSLQRALRDAA
jgi:Mrp family chromosome partitioning ATPase